MLLIGDIKFDTGHGFHVSNVLFAATSFNLRSADKIPERSVALVKFFGVVQRETMAEVVSLLLL